MNAGSAVGDIKLWLTELGIDSSNFEDLIRQELEENQQANITVHYKDSKGKHPALVYHSLFNLLSVQSLNSST